MSRQQRKVGLWIAFKNEFKLENLSLSFEKNSQFRQRDPEDILEYFHSSIWPCCNRLVYVIYRIAIAFYYTIWLIESIVRNAEFRSKNFKISNKEKTNIFSIHPWPFYMTSWSLTVLFFHLWLSAFIVLYFYSINKKSCLASFFSYLFGPFSCSKSSNDSSKKNTNNNNNNNNNNVINNRDINRRSSNEDDPNGDLNFLNRVLKRISRSTTSPIPSNSVQEENNEFKELKSNKTNLNVEPTVANLDENALLKEQNKFRNNSNDNYESNNRAIETNISSGSDNEQNSLNKTENQVNFYPDTGNPIELNINENTYCNNKSKCYMPSSTVTSDAVAWKLWVDTHVPCVILISIKISWLLYNIVAISAIVVSVVYFSYVYLADLQVEPSWVQEIGNVHRHGINSIVAIIDILILAYPVRILHFIYVNAYGWLYAIITFIYWIQNPKENIIYDQIDYNKPFEIFVYYFFLTILVAILQTFHFLAYRLKLCIKENYLSRMCNCFDQNARRVNNECNINTGPNSNYDANA